MSSNKYMAGQKSAKKLHPMKLTPEMRMKQFPGSFYVDGCILFCHACVLSVDWTRKDTIKDHLNSAKHRTNLARLRQVKHFTEATANSARQTTITSTLDKQRHRQEFIEDFVAMCVEADIPLEKLKKMRPFMVKHCRQGGALPKNPNFLRQLQVERVFEQHMSAVLAKLQGKKLSVVVDESTDDRDVSVLNIVIGVEGTYYLTDVIFMEACNSVTLSQTVIKSLHSNNLSLDDVQAVVTDSAAYCLKAFREGLKPNLPNSLHVTCLCHILNLVGEAFQHFKAFIDVNTFVTFVKSSFFKKPARKRRWRSLLLSKGSVKVNVPPEPCSSRWNTWFEAVKYHVDHLEYYLEFYEIEYKQSSAMAIQRILEILRDTNRKDELHLHMTFLTECSPKVMTALTFFEGTHSPVALSAYNLMEELLVYLHTGTTRSTGYGPLTDDLLDTMNLIQKKKSLENFQGAFQCAYQKFMKHWDNHNAKSVYQQLRIFDPRQAPSMPTNIEEYRSLPELVTPKPQLCEEWPIYIRIAKDEPLSTPFSIEDFWKGVHLRIPTVAEVALPYLYFPVSSVDTERSFSKYKTLLTDKRESLTERNTKMLVIMNHNGDVSGRWE